MKSIHTYIASSVLLLFGCTGDAPPTVGPDAEVVKLVMFYSDGDWDWKRVGNWALINTGELLQVQRRTIQPSANLVTGEWNNRFLPAVEAPPQQGTSEMRLDRAKGVLCLGGKCGALYSICPHPTQQRNGKKCTNFGLN